MGSIAATLGIIFPSIFIMSIVSFFMKEFAENIYVDYAFAGIRCAVLVLIINATVILFKEMGKYYMNYIVMAVSFILIFFFKTNIVVILLIDIIMNLILSHYVQEDR